MGRGIAQLDWRSIGRGIVLAVAYALCFWILRNSNITLDQWYLPAGLRVAALLLFRRSYWPYLIVGESAALLYLRIPRIDEYGVPFVFFSAITAMPLVAYLVWLHRKKRADAEGIQWLLQLAGVAAIGATMMSALLAYGLIDELRVPTDRSSEFKYIVGDYLGILTLAPIVLLWQQRKIAYPFPRKLHVDSAVALAVIIALFVMAVMLPDPAAKNTLRILMILPAAALTFLQGWRGAAVGVVSVNVAIAMTITRTQTEGNSDPNALAAQLVLATIATILLGLGSTISRYYRNAIRYGLAEAKAMEIARKSFVASEHEMQRRVQYVDDISDVVSVAFQSAAKRLRDCKHSTAALELRNYSATYSAQLKEQLRHIYPADLAQHGLYKALSSSMIAGQFGGRCNVISKLRGDDAVLSADLQLMIYRTLSDLLALLAIAGHQNLILQARCRRTLMYSGIAICITAPDAGFKPEIAKIDNLDASGRALAYGGRVHLRGRRIYIVMHEPIGRTTESGLEQNPLRG